MRIIFLLVSYLCIQAITSSCSSLEARKDVDLHVYCQQAKYTKELQLYINDTFKGKIPFSPEKFTCNNPAPAGVTLNLNLNPGTYNLTVTTLDGVQVSKGLIILTENDMELSGMAGGMDARQTEQCLYLEIL
jgi:hypothetical protein